MNTFSHFTKPGIILILISGLLLSCHDKDPQPAPVVLPCLQADATITDIVFDHVKYVGNFSLSFALTNAGLGKLYPDSLHFQVFISKDTLLNDTDISIAELPFDDHAPVLAAGERFVTEFSWLQPNPDDDFRPYKYLLVQLTPATEKPIAECHTDNNSAFQRIAVDIPRNGLVAFYPFNENAKDASGHHLDGTPMNGPVLQNDRFNNSTGCYSFDGVDDYITMGNPALLQISNKLTVAGWFNTPTFDIHQTVIAKVFYRDGNFNNGYEVFQSYTGKNIPSMDFGVYTFNESGDDVTGRANGYVGGSLTEGQWTFFCLVVDGADWKFYHNGVLTNSGHTSSTLLADGSKGDLTIGNNGRAFNFHGRIDDIAIYNRALIQDEVTQLFRQTITKE